MLQNGSVNDKKRYAFCRRLNYPLAAGEFFNFMHNHTFYRQTNPGQRERGSLLYSSLTVLVIKVSENASSSQ